jgi:hypothetical protein
VRVWNTDHYSKDCLRFLFNTFVAYRYGAMPVLIAMTIPIMVVGMVADIDRSYQAFADPDEEGSEQETRLFDAAPCYGVKLQWRLCWAFPAAGAPIPLRFDYQQSVPSP